MKVSLEAFIKTSFYLSTYFNNSIMPKNKNCCLREKILDRLLRTTHGLSTQELCMKVNRELEEIGISPVSCDTIRSDLLDIENRFYVNIVKERDVTEKRVFRYRYEHPSYSIFSHPLTKQHVKEIRGALEVLSAYSGMPQCEWIDELCSHFDVVCDPRGYNVVQFEKSCCDKGMEFFSPLYHAILDHSAGIITYKKFGCDETKHIISPYYLKQFSRRWYLIAKSSRHMNSAMCVLSLDRITSFTVDGSKKYIPTKMTIEEYYKDVYGIARPENISPITIRFYVSAKDLPYLLTAPIHSSQIIHAKNRMGAIMSIHVIPNRELMMRFLAYGDGVIVLTDCKIRDEIISKIRKMSQNYSSPK